MLQTSVEQTSFAGSPAAYTPFRYQHRLQRRQRRRPPALFPAAQKAGNPYENALSQRVLGRFFLRLGPPGCAARVSHRGEPKQVFSAIAALGVGLPPYGLGHLSRRQIPVLPPASSSLPGRPLMQFTRHYVAYVPKLQCSTL